jgi:hypothetical protein
MVFIVFVFHYIDGWQQTLGRLDLGPHPWSMDLDDPSTWIPAHLRRDLSFCSVALCHATL